jgi:dihydroxy-acid dehydratase
LVEDNDWIEIDIRKHQINLLVDEKTLAIRRSSHKPQTLKVSKGILFKYAQQVKTAADGCVTDEA